MAGQLDDKAHWPLGKPTVYGNNYDPSLLQPIQRSESRQALGFTTNDTLPFHGTDIWNAYELSWLETSGKPAVGRLVLEIPAAVPQTVESKSLKLYLGSFSQTAYASSEQVMAAIERDLTALLGGCVNASLVPLEPNEDAQTSPLQKPYLNAGGSPVLLDELDVTCEHYHPNPELLRCDATRVVNKGTLYTHLFRSLCPVTGQPDWASVMVRYSGRHFPWRNGWPNGCSVFSQIRHKLSANHCAYFTLCYKHSNMSQEIG